VEKKDGQKKNVEKKDGQKEDVEKKDVENKDEEKKDVQTKGGEKKNGEKSVPKRKKILIQDIDGEDDKKVSYFEKNEQTLLQVELRYLEPSQGKQKQKQPNQCQIIQS
jgi:hypothetical protein